MGNDPHRYLFRVYALSEPVTLPDKPTADDVHDAMRRHQLASGTLVGTYAR